jgi:hypothetical protein
MRKLLLAALLTSPLLVSAAPVNLLLNGSFEDDAQGTGSWSIYSNLTGWSGGASGIELRDNVAGTAQDGSNYVELDTRSNSWLSQSFATVANAAYTLSFYYSNRTNTAVATNGISFGLGAGAVGAPTLAFNSSSDNQWHLVNYDFIATGASTTLTFAALGTSDSYGSSLDNVKVTAAIPEPQTYALMLAGIGAVWFMTRRRNRR